ncbi:DUF6233 domain-containing protein [Streptomyces sp. McG3]|uniref:DUF6233 domain-containing protein n=1 Tax=unclassified Streptomyces TaxID=2593676 RepID=UPI0025530B5F|nr:DUF6233 domain-containing protein [Streptomyces sp. McG3]
MRSGLVSAASDGAQHQRHGQNPGLRLRLHPPRRSPPLPPEHPRRRRHPDRRRRRIRRRQPHHPAPQPPAAARTARPRRTPASDWGTSSVGIGAPVAEIHRGDCFAGGRAMQPVSAERARAELADGVQACGVCRPDKVLNRP